LKDGLVQKIFTAFRNDPDFPAVTQFLGDPKILETQISLQFLGILKDRLIQNYSEHGLPRIFLRILKGWTHPKKSEPANLSAIYWDFKGTDLPKKLSHWTANPANREA
jgi:hypothetical protein